MFRKDLRIAIFTLIAGLALVLISPWLWSLPTLFGVSFEHSGQIGDTIGGTTAPIVGLIGAILLFLALKAQINANKIIMDQMQEQRELDSYQKLSTYLTQQVQMLREDINEFGFTESKTTGPAHDRFKHTIQYKGVEAIMETLQAYGMPDHDHDAVLVDIPHFAHIRMIIERLSALVEDIKSKPLKDVDKVYLLGTARFTYEARLRPVLLHFEDYRGSNQRPCGKCGRVHRGIPEEIYKAYDKLNAMLG